MGCCNSQHRGCFTIENDDNSPRYQCASASLNKLNVHDWLIDLHQHYPTDDLVEIRFKNTRKGFFQNVNQLKLVQGDVVAVESSPGHDIGVVSMVGPLVKEQITKTGTRENEFKKIYRKAKPLDIEKWEAAQKLEEITMLRSRVLARELNLDMKIGDVEFQGDKTKAIFYYIADERVDFRQLIKHLADEFKIRIEMRQIGARQEAGRIGGIGSCGRELCCSGWLTNFNSVSTNAARDQEMSLNPQKLAGQCGKLKCCLNFEVDVYKDARKQFPDTNVILDTDDGPAYYQKSDVLQGIMWYSFNPQSAVNLTPIKVERVKEIISLNKSGKKVKSLNDIEEGSIKAKPEPDYSNIVGQDSLTRFDKPKRKPNPRHKNRGGERREFTPNSAEKSPDVSVKSSETREQTPQNKPVQQSQSNQKPRQDQKNEQRIEPQNGQKPEVHFNRHKGQGQRHGDNRRPNHQREGQSEGPKNPPQTPTPPNS
jgi:cell fate regulator YaaT (PSP1 superfamily)